MITRSRVARDPDKARGQSLVEFALVIPIIVLLVAGFVEVGRAVYSYNTLANAAREGARIAAVNQISAATDCDESRPVEDPANAHWSIIGCVRAAAGVLGTQAGDITVSYLTPPNTSLSCTPTLHVGCIASVTVAYQYSVSTPLISAIVPSIAMSSTSQMPVERVFP